MDIGRLTESQNNYEYMVMYLHEADEMSIYQIHKLTGIATWQISNILNSARHKFTINQRCFNLRKKVLDRLLELIEIRCLFGIEELADTYFQKIGKEAKLEHALNPDGHFFVYALKVKARQGGDCLTRVRKLNAKLSNNIKKIKKHGNNKHNRTKKATMQNAY